MTGVHVDPTDDIEPYALNASGVVNIAIWTDRLALNGFKLFRENWIPVAVQIPNWKRVKDLGKVVSLRGLWRSGHRGGENVLYSRKRRQKKRYLPDGTMVLGNTAADGICVVMVPFRMRRRCEGIGGLFPLSETLADTGIPPVSSP